MEYMKITKFGHSCLLVEEGETRILIDPGAYSEGHTELNLIDAVFITHEHPDHCDPESLKSLLSNNLGLVIYTNSDVGKKLEEAGIAYTLCEDGAIRNIKGVDVEAFGKQHAEIYSTLPRVANTGYLINERLFHPGDSVEIIPSKPVEILALPVVAPWMKSAMAIDFAKTVNPKVCFPIHDGFLKFGGPFHALPEKVLTPLGIQWIVLEQGKAVEF